MTQTGNSNAIVNLMLGWLKGLANWVLRLFNLSGGFSPLKFLAHSWLQILIFLLIVGMAADLLIWLIRWRPHWVWFHKKRVIINDKNFFAGENEVDEEDDWDLPAEYLKREREERSRRDWHDNDFVVAGAARRRREEREREQARLRREREEQLKAQQAAAETAGDVFTDGMFNVNAKQRFSDRYEDEVFSVSNLPQLEAAGAGDAAQPRRGERGSLRSGRDPRQGSRPANRERRPAARSAKPDSRGRKPAPRSNSGARRTGDSGARRRQQDVRGRR